MEEDNSNKKRKNPFVVLFKNEWKYLGSRRKIFLWYMFFFLIAGIISLMTPLLIGKIFNAVQEQITTEAELWHLIRMISLVLVIGIVFWLFHGVARILEQRSGFLTAKEYTNTKIERVLELPTKWHKDHHSGDTIDKIRKGSGATDEFSQHITFQLMYFFTDLVGSAIILFFIDWVAAVTSLVFSALIIFTITRFDKRLIKKYRERNKLENKAAATIHDYVSNIITVITLRLKKTVQREVDHKLTLPYKPHKESTNLNEVKWSFASVAIDIMVVGLLSYRAYADFHTTGVILVGTLYMLYGYLSKMGHTFFSLAHLYGTVVRLGASTENAEPIDEAYNQIKKKLGSKLPSDWKKVDLKGIDFTYNADGKVNHLEQVNFSFKRGEKIALVGESGSGKSTFLSLIRGLHDPDAGSAFVDGKLLPKGISHLHNHVTLIPQDPEIFNNTIRFNIAMGIRYKKEELRKAIKMAQLEKVIKRLDKGLDTNVMEKGVSLSGGEKQRLALARGLLAAKDSDIVLMDEPTSSVDSMNEVKIHEKVFEAFKKKTIISSIHRLHLLNKFDTIYFFEKGKLIASGTLSQMRKVPKFKRLLDKYKSAKD